MNERSTLKTPRIGAAASPLLIAALGSQRVDAQVPGAFVTIAPEDEPLQGPGQSTLSRDQDSLWSRPPRPSLFTGWTFILLTDLDGDGRDDLCGLYGLNKGQQVYGCVRNSVSRTFYGRIVQAEAFNGRRDPSIHSTISVVDLNGDGGKHLCGRTLQGMKCQRFNVSRFDPPVALFPNNPEVNFSDANFWDTEPYYSTIGFARLSGKLALCGRGFDGVMCFIKSSATFNPTPKTETSFSDANGWDRPQYYRTLRYVDIDGDGDSDICARGRAGILCSLWRRIPNSHFEPSRVWTEQFRDIDGWSDQRYYTSIRFGELSGDGIADICGRGSQGLYCGINTSRPSLPGFSFTGLSLPVQTQMNDALRWGIPDTHLRAISIIDFDGDGKNDVCGLNAPTGGYPDLFCAKSRSTSTGAAFDALVTRTKNVNFVVDDAHRLVAGRLYAGGRIGFCWNLQDGTVNCSAEWR